MSGNLVQLFGGPFDAKKYSSTKALALEYARQGVKVFPLQVGGKAPVTSNGLYSASNEESVISTLWGETHFNIGIPTGKANGFFVVDVDHPPTWWELLAQNGGELPKTPAVKTGKGLHVYFAMPEGEDIRNSASKIAKGIDVRGTGGYVVAAGSVHPDGGHYEFEDVSLFDMEPAPAPAWILEALKPKPKPEPAPKPAQPVPSFTGGNNAYAQKALEDECAKVATAPEGQRNHTLNAAAFSIAQLVAGGEIGEQEAFNALLSAALSCGLGEQEALRTMQSAGTAGATTPRNKPKQTDPLATHNPALGLLANYQKRGEQTEEDAEETKEPTKPPRLIEWIDAAEHREPTPLDFVVEDYLVAGTLSLLWGRDGSGKSFVVQDMAMSVATGKDWHGREVKAGTVLYIAGEGQEDLPNRLQAWLKHYDMEGVKPNLFYTALGIDVKNPLIMNEVVSMVQEVEEARGAVTLIVIDTLSTNFGEGSENDDKFMRPFAHNLIKLGKATGAHILVIHHSGKDKEKGARGNTLIQGEAYTKMEITRKDETAPIRLNTLKLKGAPEPKPITFNLEEYHLGQARNHKGQMQDIRSAVPLPDKDPDAAAKMADNLISATERRREEEANLGINQRTILRIIREMRREILSNKPDTEQILIEYQELRKRVVIAGISAKKVSEYKKEAISRGWLEEINSRVLSVLVTT